MATTPSAFFQDSGAADAVSFAIKNGAKSFTKFYAGTAKADQFVGTKGNDVFVLGAGDKIKNSGGGYDAVVTDRSFTIGNTGIDAVKLTGHSNVNIVGDKANNNLFGNDGANNIKGGDGKDVVAGGAGNDKLYGGEGNDTVLGGAGNDKVYGDAGNDRVDGGEGNDSVYGGKGNDSVYGGAGDDRVYGDDGNDKLYGDDGNDKLFGGKGDDILTGGAGNDTLVGDKGSNTLIGGEGNDTFMIAKQKGEVDVIKDFHKGEDIIDLSDTSAHSMKDVKLASDHHGNTIVTVKGGVQIKLIGYDPNDIDGSFFHF